MRRDLLASGRHGVAFKPDDLKELHVLLEALAEVQRQRLQPSTRGIASRKNSQIIPISPLHRGSRQAAFSRIGPAKKRGE